MATIDGRAVAVQPGETILAAARRVGLDVPALCYVEGLRPEGGCRMCLVEVDGSPRPVAACHTPLAAGARVRTLTPALEALRRDLLSLYLDEDDGAAWAAGPETPFTALLRRHGLALAPPARGSREETHPYLRFTPSLCITCRRCVHVCEEVQGRFVYSVAGRGAGTHLVFGPSERFADSPCTACGACVDACPTAALSDRDRIAPPAAPERRTRSVCGYCGVGCRVEVVAAAGRVVRVEPVKAAAVNRGHLCAKGRYAHGWHRATDRLTRPLVRRGDQWDEVPWSEAVGLIARRLQETVRAHGPAAVAALTSSRSTNEAAYLLQKLFRAVLGTNNVDCCARVCHASTALALSLTTGTGAATASYADIERARCIVVVGANPTEAHPVLGARIEQAALNGTRLVVIDPRRIELADYAELHVALRPGTNVAVLNALAALLVAGDRIDREYLEARTEGFAALRDFLAQLDVDEAARAASVPAASLRAAAGALGAGPALFVHGLGLSELTEGTASVMALANLGMLTGSIGRPGAGLLPLRGQNNVQGNADMGGLPDRITGYQALDDPEAQARAARLWGRPPPAAAGLTLPEMIDEAARGALRTLWVQGEDLVQSEPNEPHVRAALERLDFLVVQEMFLTDTARYAHVVLPAAGALEQDGTFTNAERRIQRVRAAVSPPGEARPDWQAIVGVARALGAGWTYAHPGEVMDEIAALAPHLFGGVGYDRLDDDGLQWPCPSPDHPGTATVHADRFVRGLGRLVVVEPAPNPEHGVPGYPYLLITGRVLHQYNVGTMTRRTPQVELAPTDRLEVHPEDASALGLRDGGAAVVESRWGEATVPVRVSRRLTPGTLFLSFHHPETHANRLTGPHLDPDSRCPQYKATAVRVRPGVAGCLDRAAHSGDAAPRQ